MTDKQLTITEAPVHYHPGVEQILENEQEMIDKISRMMIDMAKVVTKNEGAAMRATHSKATGLLKGELLIAEDLPVELAQGLFASPGRYDALIRFSQGPSQPVSDKASGQRGMSIKVLGVNGPHIAESREKTTQDWVLAVEPAFVSSNAKAFYTNFQIGASNTPHFPEGAIVALSRAARGVEAVLETVGAGSGNLWLLGRTPRHPASDPYYSQAPVRFGEHIAKIAAFPTEQTLAGIGDPHVDTSDDDNAFRDAMVAYFAKTEAEYEIRVQLCTNLDTMPVEDASVEWAEKQSPYRTVARLILPMQNAYSEERRQYFEERLAFNPAHTLEAHRPLGSVMRARMQAYMQTQEYRQHTNHVVPAEPRSCAEVPD